MQTIALLREGAVGKGRLKKNGSGDYSTPVLAVFRCQPRRGSIRRGAAMKGSASDCAPIRFSEALLQFADTLSPSSSG
jgi:hypothetical protein